MQLNNGFLIMKQRELFSGLMENLSAKLKGLILVLSGRLNNIRKGFG